MTTILTVALNVNVTKDTLVIAKFALMRMNVSLVFPSMSVQKTRTTAIKTPLVRILMALMNVM